MASVASLYLEHKMSIPQIAARLGEPRSRVRQKLLEAGITLRTRAEGVRLRSDVMGLHLIGRPRPMSDATKAKLSLAKLALAEKTAKGTSLKPSGYVEITRGPNKGRGQHVVIMEERIGRRLLPDECVHHIDGNRANNSPNNLALVTRPGHMRLHKFEEKLTKGKTNVG